MFLLMRVLLRAQRPAATRYANAARPSRSCEGRQSLSTVRLDDLGELRSEGSSEQGERQDAKRQSRSAVFVGGYTPTPQIVRRLLPPEGSRSFAFFSPARLTQRCGPRQ